jgi:hypothetical protein
VYRTSDSTPTQPTRVIQKKRNMTRKLGSELKIANARGVLAHLAIETRYEKEKKIRIRKFRFQLPVWPQCHICMFSLIVDRNGDVSDFGDMYSLGGIDSCGDF